MKKVLVVCVSLAAGLVFTSKTEAQVKIGIFDEQAVLSLMPGVVQKVDSAMNQYVNDSLKVEYDYTIDEYKRLDSTFKKDSAAMNPSRKSVVQGELMKNLNKIQNWQRYQEQKYNTKEQEILKPYLERIFNALQEVIAEGKYTFVFKADAIHPYTQAPIMDNLIIKVAQKMKLKLPADVEEALRAAQGGGAPKPPVRAPGKN